MEACKRYGRLYLLVLIVAAVGTYAASGAWSYLTVSGPYVPSGPVVVLDAGHGGEDGGAISVTGVQESGINLAITLRLRDLLRLLGCEPVLTRDGDYAIYDDDCSTIAQKKASDLRNRVALIQQTGPSVLMSIHQNQFEQAQYSGAQVFYATTQGSAELAEQLQQALCTGLDPDNHRKCKPIGAVYLMQHVDCTAVLIECGFLSNREDEALLRSEDYQKQLSCAITAGLLQYLGEQNTL